MVKKVALITGAAAMDSQTMTHFLIEKGYDIILTYRPNNSLNLNDIYDLFQDDLKKHTNATVNFEICDITDRNSIEECLKSTIKKFGKIDEIYLFAALSHVGMSFKQKDYAILANGQSYFFFLDLIKNLCPAAKVFGALTSELCAGLPGVLIRVNEYTPWMPNSPYAIGKALGGHWINFYRENYNIFACYAILFSHSNIYRNINFFIRKITSGFAKIAANKQKIIKLGDINFSRDESYADFMIEAIWRMLQNNKPEDYVIGNGELIRGIDYIKYAAEYFNLNYQKYIEFNNNELDRPKENKSIMAECGLAQRGLSWQPNRITFKKHIELMCKYDFELETKGVARRQNVFELK